MVYGGAMDNSGDSNTTTTGTLTFGSTYQPHSSKAVERLAKVMLDLPAVPKAQRNQQQGYAFRGIEDMTAALKPALAKHEVVIIPQVLERLDSIRSVSNNRALFTVLLRVKYTFATPDGIAAAAEVWGEGTDMGDKATNKAMTSAFKYMLAQVFCVSDADSKDPDATSPEAEGAPVQPHDHTQPEGKPKARTRKTKAKAEPEPDPLRGLPHPDGGQYPTSDKDKDKDLLLASLRAGLRGKFGSKTERIQEFLRFVLGDEYSGDLAKCSLEQLGKVKDAIGAPGGSDDQDSASG